jgi:SAM-dependent methyltransferase
VIKAFSRIHDTLPKTVLVLKKGIGGESAQADIDRLIRENGIRSSTVVVGDLTEAELPLLYSAADVTVSFSSSDGTPMSILEAMASGSAVIGGDLPSIREWVRDGETGLLARVPDLDVLVSQLERLVTDAELRRALTARARRLVEQHADRQANLERVETEYVRLAPATDRRVSLWRSRLRAIYGALPTVTLRLLGPFLGPPSSAEKAFVGRRQRSYQEAVSNLGDDHWRQKALALGIPSEASVIDVGCGPGQWLPPLAATTKRVVGVDINDELLRVARVNTIGLSKVHLFRAAAEQLPFRDKAFDAALCYSVLMYTDARAAITELSRVLKPGGRLVVGVVGAGYYLMHLVAGIRCRDLETVRYAMGPLLSRLRQRLVPTLRVVTPWSGNRLRRHLHTAGFDVLRLFADRKDPEWPEVYLGCRFFYCAEARKRS